MAFLSAAGTAPPPKHPRPPSGRHPGRLSATTHANYTPIAPNTSISNRPCSAAALTYFLGALRSCFVESVWLIGWVVPAIEILRLGRVGLQSTSVINPKTVSGPGLARRTIATQNYDLMRANKAMVDYDDPFLLCRSLMSLSCFSTLVRRSCSCFTAASV